MKKLYACMIALGIATATFAQSASWTVYNNSNSGISNDNVHVILIDSVNNKWFGTDNGLVKFDDASWKKVFVSNITYSGTMDSTSQMWLGYDSFIALFTSNSQYGTFYMSGPTQPNYITSSIAIDPVNTKWFGMKGGGILKQDAAYNRTIYNSSNSGLPSDIVTAVEADRNGILWTGTEMAGLASFDGTTWTTYNTSNSALPDNNITSIAVDSHNNKWIGTGNGGLAKFDGTIWTIYNQENSGLPDAAVSVVEVDRNNLIWIGTANGGAASFDGNTWKTYNRANSGLPENEVLSIAFDHSNNTWFGTPAGAAKLTHQAQSTGVEEKSHEPLSAKAYPNPSNGSFNVKFDRETVTKSIGVTDILGNTIWQEQRNDNASEIKVHVPNAVPGVYFLNIVTTERTFVQKISIR